MPTNTNNINHKNYKLKILQEASWEDAFEDEDPVDDVVDSASALNSHEQSLKAISSLEDLEKIDKQFDSLYKNFLDKNDDINLFSAKVQRIELSKTSQLYKREKEKEEPDDPFDDHKQAQEELNKLFNNESNDILKIFQSQTIHNNRKDLYEMYDEIADINYIAYKMLRVYLDNILIKNAQTKTFINIKENEDNKNLAKIDDTKLDFIKKMLDMFLVFFDIQNKLKNQIVPKTLKYGDFYIEVVDLSKIDNILYRQPQLLTENFVIENNGRKKTYKNVSYAYLELPYKENFMESMDAENINESKFGSKKDSIHDLNNLAPAGNNFENLEESFQYKLEKLRDKLSARVLEESDIPFLKRNDNEEFDIENLFKMDLDKIENIYLRLQDPSKVLKVEQDGVLYGYLVIEDVDREKNGDEEEINIYKRFLSDNESGSNDDVNKNVTKNIAGEISEKISERLAEFINQKGDFEAIPDELKASLRVIIYQKLLKKSKIKFRFLETSDMVNFHTVIDKFAPYGTSIFDPIIQPVKMYTIGLMTSIVSRLSRAAVIRKWNIEVGNKRNYQAVIEQVKKDLRNKSVTYDSLTSIKNISKMITDFKDIATVTRDGQRFIDLEVMPMHDRSLPIQELQDLKTELIAATGIPATYLNMPDAVDLRETLVNININFANTIISQQSYIEDGLNILFNIIIKKLLNLNGIPDKGFNISSIFKLTLNTPLVLQLQQSEALVGSIINIIGALNQAQLQIDPLKLLEMYIPQMNWEALKKSGEELTRDEIKKQIMMQQDGQQAGGF